ncbi:unnamed protein product [Sympodiomycopsis kandeliae]
MQPTQSLPWLGNTRESLSMVAGMTPHLHEQDLVYASIDDDALQTVVLRNDVVAIFREKEGLSVIIHADAVKLLSQQLHNVSTKMQRIELQVYSSLEGVGLTAAVSSALAAEGISCNILAALRHDHLIIPKENASQALDLLGQIAKTAQQHLDRL